MSPNRVDEYWFVWCPVSGWLWYTAATTQGECLRNFKNRVGRAFAPGSGYQLVQRQMTTVCNVDAEKLVLCNICGASTLEGKAITALFVGTICGDCESKFIRRKPGKEFTALVEAVRNETAVPREVLEKIELKEKTLQRRLEKASK